MSNKKGQLSKVTWLTIILFMFMSAIVGTTESMYLGLFLNNTVFKDGSMGAKITLTDTVNLIASLSAVVSVITTFVIGTLSEKMKNRRIFVSTGFIAWGTVMLVFSRIDILNVAGFLRISTLYEAVTVTAITIVCFALILTFLRSTTCDAAFNSWVTDVSTPETSAIIEIAFTIMGFVSTAVITLLVSGAQSEQLEYSDIFIILGLAGVVFGIIGFFLIKNPPQKEENTKKLKKLRNTKRLNNKKEEEKRNKYLEDLLYGFKPSAIKENINLYLMLSSGCTFNCACQVFMPYLFIYIASVVIPANQDVDLLSTEMIIAVVIALVAVVVSVLILMKLYTKSKALSFIPSVIFLIVGLFILSSTKSLLGIVIGLAPGLIGYIIIMIQFGATVRDNIPKDKVGLFQGIRMIFLFCIPGIIGPTLGNIAAKNSEVTYMENGAEKVLPTEAMFLYAAIVAALIFIPMLTFLKKDREKALKEKN
ncbi:MAG: MFS transporter [Clostridia bacterium]|nr:MFS transporter [Clostridia bacterium]